MARTLRRNVEAPLSEQGKGVLADSNAAVEALQVALDDAEASHATADTAIAQLRGRLGRWSELDARLAKWGGDA